MATLYDELGVSPGTDAEGLRNAYRREARRRHPDMHPGREEEAQESMRRLNAAWAILGNRDSRRAYDASLTHGVAPSPGAAAGDVDAEGLAEVLPGVHGFRLRLWPLVLVVLLVIFVFTAYASQGSHTGKAPARPSDAAADRCISSLPGVDYVPCDQPNVGRLVREVTVDEACPSGSFRHVLIGGRRVACVRRG